jgi:hypothetical protein
LYDGVASAGVKSSRLFAAISVAILAFPSSLLVAAASSTSTATARSVHEFAMPTAVCVVKTNLASLAEPEWLVKADADGVEPWVTRRFIGKEKDYVDFFE